MRHGWGMVCAVTIALWCGSASAATGEAVLEATSAEAVFGSGEATMSDTASGLRIVVEVEGLSPGKHGIHIHEHGDCGDAGAAAGGHYNPGGVKHGYLPGDGPKDAHPGDMGNIEVKEDGTAYFVLTLPRATVGEGPYSMGDRAIIIHADEDDFSQPTGNAGGRIACGVITVSEDEE